MYAKDKNQYQCFLNMRNSGTIHREKILTHNALMARAQAFWSLGHQP